MNHIRLFVMLLLAMLSFAMVCLETMGLEAADQKESPTASAPAGSAESGAATAPKPTNKDAGADNELEDGDPFDDPFGKEEDYQEPDPLEGMNRFFFDFNDFFYTYGFDPLARGYDWLVPEIVRKGIRNVFNNLKMPVRLVSSLGQAKFAGAGREIGRFAINTSAGVGGLFDIASELEIDSSDEDVGQMFGAWGIGHGFYVVLPFFGPSSARDGFGLIGDLALTPTTYVPTLATDNTAGQLGLTASIYTYQFVNTASLHLGEYEQLKDSSVDPYVLFRDIYLQNRAKKQKE